MGLSYSQKLSQVETLTQELAEAVDQRAREVCAARGVVLDYNPGSQYSRPLSYDSHSRDRMEKWHTEGEYSRRQHMLTYPMGTPLLTVRYEEWVGDGIESIDVTFPESYLDDPNWLKAEQPNIAAQRAREAATDAQREADARQRKLREFERLRAELEL